MSSIKIALTGFMCSGKTTVARAVGQLLRCTVLDLDEAIVESERRSAAEIIERDGEDAFRDTETRVLARLLSRDTASIISLGGGTWTKEENRKLLADHGYVTVWLDVSFEVCWKRIKHDGKSRPLARSCGAAKQLYENRRSVYASAGFRISIAAAETAEDIASKITALVLRDVENS